MTILSFEDFTPGHFGRFGPRRVTREEIIAFAREYDPQPMHLDDRAAEASMLRGLSGSGWHLSALMMRMLCEAPLNGNRRVIRLSRLGRRQSDAAARSKLSRSRWRLSGRGRAPSP